MPYSSKQISHYIYDNLGHKECRLVLNYLQNMEYCHNWPDKPHCVWTEKQDTTNSLSRL